MAVYPGSGHGGEEDNGYDPLAPPRVGTTPSLWPLVIGGLGALALGTIVFLQLTSQRNRIEEARLTDPAPQSAPLSTQGVPPPPEMPVYTPPPPPEPMPEVVYEEPPPPPLPEPAMTQAEIDRLRAPALIVDLSEFRAADGPALPATGSPLDPAAVASAIGGSMAGRAAGLPGMAGAGGDNQLNSNESFASRLGVGGDPTKPAVAVNRINPPATIVEGAVIPAVLETPINSDLPGYVRAVVSRDVRGFDGSQVLVPRGSRLIGQYRSGVALGQSRAFVIWTRLIRPDGAAIELASPSTDALGRGGLDGDVNRHFLQRFGGAILLSLINLGAAVASDSTDTSIVIASTRAGTDAAGVALAETADISPTITVPQGSPVRVFVSQDLDFSRVGPAPPPVSDGLP
jgi:type IV secretion system protein VirB10